LQVPLSQSVQDSVAELRSNEVRKDTVDGVERLQKSMYDRNFAWTDDGEDLSVEEYRAMARHAYINPAVKHAQLYEVHHQYVQKLQQVNKNPQGSLQEYQQYLFDLRRQQTNPPQPARQPLKPRAPPSVMSELTNPTSMLAAVDAPRASSTPSADAPVKQPKENSQPLNPVPSSRQTQLPQQPQPFQPQTTQVQPQPLQVQPQPFSSQSQPFQVFQEPPQQQPVKPKPQPFQPQTTQTQPQPLQGQPSQQVQTSTTVPQPKPQIPPQTQANQENFQSSKKPPTPPPKRLPTKEHKLEQQLPPSLIEECKAPRGPLKPRDEKGPQPALKSILRKKSDLTETAEFSEIMQGIQSENVPALSATDKSHLKRGIQSLHPFLLIFF
jgi:hypothetical protein